MERQERREEEQRFQRASKLRLSKLAKEDLCGMFWKGYEVDNGFFDSVAVLKQYCAEEGIPVPEYVWATKPLIVAVDAKELVEDTLERLDLEEGMERIHPVDIELLQEMLDKWWEEQSISMGRYTVDYDLAILLNE